MSDQQEQPTREGGQAWNPRAVPRPLSPHLQVYRLPLTAILSILHRASGVYLTLGLLVWIAALFALADGPESFQAFQDLLSTVVGRLALWSWVIALYLHLSHGIRHLLWDSGLGFDRASRHSAAMLEVVATGLLTLITIVYVVARAW